MFAYLLRRLLFAAGTVILTAFFAYGVILLLRPELYAAWERIGHDRGIQGNLDGAVLLGPWERAEAGARDVLERAGGRPGHIFNLGHGVLPETDPELLGRLVQLVHESTPVAA